MIVSGTSGGYRYWLECCEAALDVEFRNRERANILWVAAMVAWHGGHFARAVAFAKQAQKLDAERGDPRARNLSSILEALGQTVPREEEFDGSRDISLKAFIPTKKGSEADRSLDLFGRAKISELSKQNASLALPLLLESPLENKYWSYLLHENRPLNFADEAQVLFHWIPDPLRGVLTDEIWQRILASFRQEKVVYVPTASLGHDDDEWLPRLLWLLFASMLKRDGVVQRALSIDSGTQLNIDRYPWNQRQLDEIWRRVLAGFRREDNKCDELPPRASTIQWSAELLDEIWRLILHSFRVPPWQLLPVGQ
jgi:hypothetical protein